MALHLIKLCVGVETIEDLADWQQAHIAEQRKAGEPPRIWHTTFQTPKRDQDLLDGGSIYWVIKGTIQVRQGISGFEPGAKSDGSKGCRILLDQKLVPVRPTPRRAFQGWRYLEPADAPADLTRADKALTEMPPAMRRALAELCLI